MGTTFENASCITITGKEYKQLILDGALQKEILRLEEERRNYIQSKEDYCKKRDNLEEHYTERLNDARELMEDNYKSKLDKYKSIIERYESNWFVKLFLKK